MFKCRLALALGKSLSQLDECVAPPELAIWKAYSNIEPFGYPMDNYRMGVPAAALYNAIIATIPVPRGKRRPKQLQSHDLYPEQKKRAAELTKEQQEYIRKKHGKRRHSNR